MMGGLVNGVRSKRVFLLDCASHHQWRALQEMRAPRANAAVDVINGKIYVVGGCKRNTSENWGEVYDTKTQTWEPLPPRTTLQGGLVLSGKACAIGSRVLLLGGTMYDVNGLKLLGMKSICLVEIDNVLCQTSVRDGVLAWYDPIPNERWGWTQVKGLGDLERLWFSSASFYITPNAISGGGRRVTVWWKSLFHGKDCHPEGCRTEVWCAEVSLERRSSKELWGFLEWSRKVFALDGCDDDSDFVLHSALMTH